MDSLLGVKVRVALKHTTLFVHRALVKIDTRGHGEGEWQQKQVREQCEGALLRRWEKDPVAILARVFTQRVNTITQIDNLDKMLQT